MSREAAGRESDAPTESDASEITYPLGAVTRLTGLSPHVLRAWERRYHVVEPLRTPGGTRRYRASDLERLRRVKAAVDAGHRISDVADLDDDALARLAEPGERPGDPLARALAAVARLDALEAERTIAEQLAALGPVRFAHRFALPLLEAVGEGWASDRVCMASEHLVTGLIRSLLGAALRPSAVSRAAPPILFATPSGERHEIGLLVAALTALGAGGNPVYLGAELPVDELVGAVRASGAAALAVGLVVVPEDEASALVAQLRERLPRHVELWIGGPIAARIELPAGVLAVDSLEALEQRVAALNLRASRGS